MARQVLSILNRVKGNAGGARYQEYDNKEVIRPIIPITDAASPAQLLIRQKYSVVLHHYNALRSLNIPQENWPQSDYQHRWGKYSSYNLPIYYSSQDTSDCRITFGNVCNPVIQHFQVYPGLWDWHFIWSTHYAGIGSPDDHIFICWLDDQGNFAFSLFLGLRCYGQSEFIYIPDPLPTNGAYFLYTTSVIHGYKEFSNGNYQPQKYNP